MKNKKVDLDPKIRSLIRFSSQRNIRLISLAFFLSILLMLSVDITMAWEFVSRLIYPSCLNPTPTSELPNYQEHFLTTPDGISIRIWYYPSQNGAAIIVFGGLTGALGIQTFPIEKLVQEGYGILQVDSRSCASPVSPVTFGGDEILDGESALEFLLKQPEVERDRIAAMGFSLGGATSIRLAAKHPEVKAVVRDGGFSNLSDLLNPPGKAPLLIKFFRMTVFHIFRIRTGVNPMSVSPIDDIEQINPRPVLLIYGESEAFDGFLQYEHAEEPKELWVVQGGAHGTNYTVAPKEYEQRLQNFFRETLLLNIDK